MRHTACLGKSNGKGTAARCHRFRIDAEKRTASYLGVTELMTGLLRSVRDRGSGYRDGDVAGISSGEGEDARGVKDTVYWQQLNPTPYARKTNAPRGQMPFGFKSRSWETAAGRELQTRERSSRETQSSSEREIPCR